MNALLPQLSAPQLRVLGALIEKEITTPEYYPLSLNALINACNQRSSRDPVLDLSQNDVLSALDGLGDLHVTAPVHDGRVIKYEHRVRTVLNLRRDETAVLCLLLLRGPQTPGELRARADRLYAFDDLAAVTATLDRLASRPHPGAQEPGGPPDSGPLTVLLSRQPGARESRYAHLLGGPIPEDVAAQPGAPPSRPSTIPAASDESLAATLLTLSERVRVLESRMERLEAIAAANSHVTPL